MPGATYSPQMIEKSDSTSLALATIAILGQAPRTAAGACRDVIQAIKFNSRYKKTSKVNRF
jgi:hypothetical protein